MKKVFYHITYKNESPLHIGSGQDVNTDMDVITDSKGQFFIPGSSFAGSIMHYAAKKESGENIFQPKKDGDYIQSPIYFSDAIMKDREQPEVRDGIQLENKVAKDGAKYDYEIIPAGNTFTQTIEIMIREDEKEYESKLENVLTAIDSGQIRIGYKMTRGLGKLSIDKVKKAEFTQENISKFISFDQKDEDSSSYKEIKLQSLASDMVHISVHLKQNGGMIIRTYNTSDKEVDYKHIYSGGKAIIPGTSWNGLIRNTIGKYNVDLDFGLDMDSLFGYVKDEKVAKSKIIIEESIFEGVGFDKELTRNSINPFTGGTKQGALFNGKYHYNDTTELNVYIPEEYEDSFIPMFMLFLKDLDLGLLALGGETSIGKGMFKVESIVINGKSKTIEDYLEVLES